MDELWVEKQKIQEVIALYADAVTQRDWHGFGDFYTEDAHWECLKPFEFEASGRAEICSVIYEARSANEFVTQLPTAIVVEYEGGDGAKARHTMVNVAASPKGSGYFSIGIFNDELRREEGRWRFLRRTYEPHFFSGDKPPGIVTELAMNPKSQPDFAI